MEIVKNEIVDYAMPLMNIERMAKDIHDMCLRRKFNDAQTVATLLAVEARILVSVLKIMQEREER